MRLGDACEISLSVAELREAAGFFGELGFRPIGDTPAGDGVALWDGAVRLGLYAGSAPSPALTYFTEDLPPKARELAAVGVDACILGAAAGAELPNPDGIRLRLVEVLESPPLPAGDFPFPLGEFGELALPVQDIDISAAFWKSLGMRKVAGDDALREDNPEPWAIYTDDLTIIGLHQTESFLGPHLTYFSADSAPRIESLKRAGVPVDTEALGGAPANAVIAGPGGLRIFVFAE
jgi:hypothetical protein